MQAESGIVPDFEVGEEFHEEPKTYYELKSQPLKSRWDKAPAAGRGAPPRSNPPSSPTAGPTRRVPTLSQAVSKR